MSRIVELRDVCKSFADNSGRRLEVLESINLWIGVSECVALVGPSGCGKTTLLRMVAGLERPTRGEVLLNGQLVSKPQVGVGIVFQRYSSFPWLTVEGNIGLGLKAVARSAAWKKEAISLIIGELGLAGFEDYFPSQVSSGMLQRVAVARALVADPPLLLLDEPLGALDIRNRILLQDRIGRILASKKAAALMISHDIEEAVLLADRVVILSDRPGTIIKTIEVPGERPRRIDKRLRDLQDEIRRYLLPPSES